MTLDDRLVRLREAEAAEVSAEDLVKGFRVTRSLERLRDSEAVSVGWRPPRVSVWSEVAAVAAVLLPALLFFSGLLPREWTAPRDPFQSRQRDMIRANFEENMKSYGKIDQEDLKIVRAFFRKG